MTMIALKKQLIKIALVACFVTFTLISNAQVRLPQLVSNDMVLQRDVKLKIWGWASPGEKVTVAFINKSYHTVADKSGNWSVELKPMKAGGPYSMDITGSNHIELNNILIGDVYFFSGQSNMTVMMERVKERYPEEIETANFPQIKYFFVPTASDAFKEHEDLPKGNWVTVDHQHILDIGAVAYFFAKQLYAKYKVPLGLINSSVGGTLIQSWISEKGLKNLEPYASRLSQLRDTAFINQANRQRRSFGPRPQRGPTTEVDKGMTEAVKWYDPKYEALGWHKFWLPGYWEDQGVKGLHGIVWFRKELDVPASMAGKPAKLFVGRIVDADETYVNGVKVGNITYQYPPRRYNIPEGVLKAGKNLIVVRITNTADKGGFVPDKRYELTDGNTSIDIRGDWLYKVGEVYPPRTGGFDNNGGVGANAGRVNPQNEPAGLYNAMIAPAVNYAVKGFLWYQGETNADSPKDYNALMTALINDWRNKWNEPDAPFLFVQLPNYMEVKYSPSESNWAQLREAQRSTLSISNTAMAVAIDLGEWNDIHPLNKKDVGERLALAAERIVYGDANVVYSGPTVQSSAKEGKQITITFTNVGSGLIVKGGGELQQFAIAGADKHFVWAKAKIEGNKVIVNSDEVADPQYVRYAWADNPEGANLYNNEGLPASPFMINTKP